MNERWGDPAAWQCLDDEQREIIKAWYDRVLEMDRKEHKREKNCMISAGYFALIPFAVAHAYGYFAGSALKFLFEFAAAFLIYSVIFYVFSDFYKHFNYLHFSGEKVPRLRVLGQAVIAFLVSFAAVSWFHS